MIQRAESQDASLLNELVNSAYRGDTSLAGWASEADLFDGTRIDLAAMKQLLTDPRFIILKYTEDDIIKGCVELHLENDRLYLGMLSVRPQLQGEGIGKKLIRAAEEEAVRQKCKSVFMTVITIREKLVQWYIRLGYLETGEKKPFDASDPRHGIPKMALELAVLEKKLNNQ